MSVLQPSQFGQGRTFTGVPAYNPEPHEGEPVRHLLHDAHWSSVHPALQGAHPLDRPRDSFSLGHTAGLLAHLRSVGESLTQPYR